MHADELDIDVDLVHQLLRTQFPAWADLEIERAPSPGTDNAIFRLGDDLAVRLPRIHWAATDGEKEHLWLPRIAPHLPVDLPVPLGLGMPGQGYPWHWSVVPWLPGKDAFSAPIADLTEFATDLARVVTALHEVDGAPAPPAGAPAASRGVPLSTREVPVRAAVDQMRGRLDVDAVAAAWETALQAPGWDGPPVWIHGDLQPTNLLVQNGRLTGVIDWGGLGMGDPAADLIPAWSIFGGPSRDAYREVLAVDEATWARGRGWALSVGLIALPYYLETNPVIVEWSRRSVDAVLADSGAFRVLGCIQPGDLSS